MSTESTPYNAQYVRNHRNDFIRLLIYRLIDRRPFSRPHLLEAVNLVLSKEEFNERHLMTKAGLDAMLNRNCEDAWTLRDGVVMRNHAYHGWMRHSGKAGEIGGVLMAVDDLIIRGDVARSKGSAKSGWNG